MAGQSGSAGAKRNKNKSMASDLKSRGVERRTGRCCIGGCNKIIAVDDPSATFQHKVFDHMAQHARGNA